MAESGEQWVPTDFRVIDSQWFDRTPGEVFKFYTILRRYVCRARTGHSLSDFYRKGLLVTAGSVRQWAGKLGKSPASVSRYLGHLENTKAIHIYQKARNETEPTILVLGRVIWTPGSEKGTELFFLDHLSEAQDPVAEMPCVTGNELGLLYAEMNGILNTETLNAVSPMEQQEDAVSSAVSCAVSSAVSPMKHRIEKSNREGNTEDKYLPPGGGELDPLIVSHNLDGVIFQLEDTGQRKEEMTAQCPRCNATHSQQMNLCPDCGAHVIWFQSPTWKRLYGPPDAYRRGAEGEDLTPRTPLQTVACALFNTSTRFANVSQQTQFKRLEKKYPLEYVKEMMAWAADPAAFKGFDRFVSGLENPNNFKTWEASKRDNGRKDAGAKDPGASKADQASSVADEWAEYLAARAKATTP